MKLNMIQQYFDYIVKMRLKQNLSQIYTTLFTKTVIFLNHVQLLAASLVAQMVKNLSAMQETQVWSLDQEDLPEKGMATHSSILAWRIPWTEESGGLQSMGSQSDGHAWVTEHLLTLACDQDIASSWLTYVLLSG